MVDRDAFKIASCSLGGGGNRHEMHIRSTRVESALSLVLDRLFVIGLDKSKSDHTKDSIGYDELPPRRRQKQS